MPRKSKNTFSVHNDEITIMREGWDHLVLTTYRSDYYDEITSHTWSLNNGYPYNATLGGGLHRYIMAKWYGEDMLKEMTEKGFIVEHMNNNHMDCRICNLEFMKGNRNVAKGQYFDKESEALRHSIAVSIFKDFTTGNYQVTIGCNANIACKDQDGVEHHINTIKLLYNCPYAIVVLDAEVILTQYDEEEQFSLKNLHHVDSIIIEAPELNLTEEEKNQIMVERDGKWYLVIGNGKSYLNSVHYDQGWETPGGKA